MYIEAHWAVFKHSQAFRSFLFFRLCVLMSSTSKGVHSCACSGRCDKRRCGCYTGKNRWSTKQRCNENCSCQGYPSCQNDPTQGVDLIGVFTLANPPNVSQKQQLNSPEKWMVLPEASLMHSQIQIWGCLKHQLFLSLQWQVCLQLFLVLT